MSFRVPSQVSATTGRDTANASHPQRTMELIVASRTTPTLMVLVIMIGPHRKPDSATQWVPVISPLPLSEKNPANTGSGERLPRGKIAVTPVRTGPLPRSRRPLPETSVACPTSTPLTSVIALRCPGVPGSGMLRSRARGLFWADAGELAPQTATSNVAASGRVQADQGIKRSRGR